ncbi:MAG TPA: zinc ribbon domain-containing protein [Acidobacteriaceae bacterium]|jgi:hypothetical protein|nr:zinc ribbon domain-containing protein [Acidobacteriaceae bacterium]
MQFITQMLHMAEALLARAMQWLQTAFHALQASPYRLTIYAVGAALALLLISIPLFRTFGRRRRNDEDLDDENLEPRSYSVLGIGPSLVQNADRSVPEHPRWAEVARPPQSVSPAVQPVPRVTRIHATPSAAPIRPSTAVLCTHCGATLSAHQDFCPACGYAQPAQQSVAFPA